MLFHNAFTAILLKVAEEGEKFTIYIKKKICLSMKVIIRDFSLGCYRLGKNVAYAEYVP